MLIDEDHIIGVLKNAYPQFIGDDAAVFSEHDQIVISKDLLVEDVHFRRHYQSPESLARKALAVNLSDIAAMGATPFAVLLGLSAAAEDKIFVDTFLQAFIEACREENVILMGGDTTRAPSNQLFLSLTILGRGHPQTLKYRHTAKINDLIYVAGPLGHAHLGFTALEANRPGFEDYKAHFLNPKARLAEGIWLANQPHVHAMMDLSDGLWVDLNKLLQASKCSALLSVEKISPSENELKAYQDLGLNPIETRLTGGEDYALLFTATAEKSLSLRTQFEAQFGYPLLQIGQIIASNERHDIQLLKENQPVTLALQPFNHFA